MLQWFYEYWVTATGGTSAFGLGVTEHSRTTDTVRTLILFHPSRLPASMQLYLYANPNDKFGLRIVAVASMYRRTERGGDKKVRDHSEVIRGSQCSTDAQDR